MRKQLFQILSVFVLAGLMLAACGGTAPAAAPTMSADQMVAALTAMAPTATLAPTATPAPASTHIPSNDELMGEVLSQAQHEPGDVGDCPNDPAVKIIWPGFNSPADENRYGVGYGEYKKVCFPNGGSVLASYISVDGKTFDDVLDCDRDKNPTATCGYLLDVEPGKTVAFHDGVAGTIYPDPKGELNGADGMTMHPWIVDITAEVFP